MSVRCEVSAEGGAGPTVLAIDTTAGACSVALAGPGRRARRAEPMTQGHSRHVLGLVDAVLAEAGVRAAEIDAIGFGAGPGSFTGLRIACGIAQGLGFGLNRPLVAVDAMRTLAAQAALAAPAHTDVLLVALDLRMGEVCVAAFRHDPGAEQRDWPSPILGPLLLSPQAAVAAFDTLAPARALLAGDGFDAYPTLADWSRGEGRHRQPSAVQPDAAAVAALAIVGLRTGRGVDAADAAPTYLRDKVALDVGEQAALRAARAAGAAR